VDETAEVSKSSGNRKSSRLDVCAENRPSTQGSRNRSLQDVNPNTESFPEERRQQSLRSPEASPQETPDSRHHVQPEVDIGTLSKRSLHEPSQSADAPEDRYATWEAPRTESASEPSAVDVIPFSIPHTEPSSQILALLRHTHQGNGTSEGPCAMPAPNRLPESSAERHFEHPSIGQQEACLIKHFLNNLASSVR
jgi:hypothetical protein